MNKKITKTLLLLTLLILLIGITSAATVPDNTTSTKTMKKTENRTNIDVKNNYKTVLEKKAINNDNINKKTSTYAVNDFSTLNNRLSMTTDSDLTINLGKNITLTKNMKINSNIKKLTINGNYNKIDGQNKFQFINLEHKADLTIKNIKITNCNAKNGGAIHIPNQAKLTLENSYFSQNNATVGGVIYADGLSETKIIKSTFHNNKAEETGGVLIGGKIEIINSTFTKNSVYNIKWTDEHVDFKFGGMIYGTVFSNITIINSNFTNNSAFGGKGGVINTRGTLKLINSSLEFNYANSGGAIFQEGGKTTLINCKLDNNNVFNGDKILYFRDDMETYVYLTEENGTYIEKENIMGISTTYDYSHLGGAIYNRGGFINITNSTLNNNDAVLGGGIRNNGNVIITCSILNNNRVESGGAIHNNGNLSIFKSVLNNNYGLYGGAITNDGKLTIIGSTLSKNNVTSWGGAIADYGHNNSYINNTFSYNRANTGSALILYPSELYDEKTEISIPYDGFTEIKNNVFKQNKANITGKAITNDGTAVIKNNINDETSKYSSTIDIMRKTNITITNNYFDDYDNRVSIKLNQIKGIIGENIILTAYLTDSNGKKISGGNLAFKLNGKTLRKDGRFDSKANAMKFNVKNGLVTYTIKADLYLRNAKYLTASYSGTNVYNECTSPPVTAQIQKRTASLTVTSTQTRAKQYETLTFRITAKDTTKNSKNNTLISDNTKVMLKVNGVTIKDNKGKTLYMPLNKNAQTTYKYTIPAGTGGITATKKIRDYTVTAIFVGDNYYPGAKNTTKFQVERSPTNVKITQVTVNNKNILTLKAKLTDYKGNNLQGTNKVTIKINGKNYVDPNTGKAKYWTVKDGNINLKNIQVNPKTTIKRVMIVTGERQAYLEGRTETTSIIRT